jgi:uncharacterized membrane protein
MDVRALSPQELTVLRRMNRTVRDHAVAHRVIAVLMSADGLPAAEIAALLKTSEEDVDGTIRDFNARGFASLQP